jgi:hypothetical protein
VLKSTLIDFKPYPLSAEFKQKVWESVGIAIGKEFAIFASPEFNSVV